jgi:hypothetical protein
MELPRNKVIPATGLTHTKKASLGNPGEAFLIEAQIREPRQRWGIDW